VKTANIIECLVEAFRQRPIEKDTNKQKYVGSEDSRAFWVKTQVWQVNTTCTAGIRKARKLLSFLWIRWAPVSHIISALVEAFRNHPIDKNTGTFLEIIISFGYIKS
jgi:hypothetical protein